IGAARWSIYHSSGESSEQTLTSSGGLKTGLHHWRGKTQFKQVKCRRWRSRGDSSLRARSLFPPETMAEVAGSPSSPSTDAQQASVRFAFLAGGQSAGR